jgi:putative aldouronate transport system permease protein
MTRYRQARDLLLMLLPCLLLLGVFAYAPMMGLLVAFKDFDLQLGIVGSPWVGMANFEALFAGGEFGRALRNTLLISGLKLTFGMVAPIALALLLHEVRQRWFRRSVLTLTYLPFLLSWVVLAGVLRVTFGHGGPLHFGVDWFTNDAWFLVLLVGSHVWQTLGYGAVIYLAALAGVAPQLYEAARIDGASRWQQCRHISLPALAPTIITLFILALGSILYAGFDQIYNLYNPQVYDSADIIETYVLRRLQVLDFELGTAAGLFSSVVGLVLIVLVNSIARRVSKGEQGIY